MTFPQLLAPAAAQSLPLKRFLPIIASDNEAINQPIRLMQTPHDWIWQYPDWPQFRWDDRRLGPALARARLAQGRILGATRLLDPQHSLEAVATVLVEDGITTSAIEGEQLDLASVRSSVARRLGLPSAGLPVPPRPVDGLIEVLLDATRNYQQTLTMDRLCGWQAALFPTGYSGLHRIRTGELRGNEPMEVISGSVGRERLHFLAPPRHGQDQTHGIDLADQLQRMLAWFASTQALVNQPGQLDGLLRAGLAHFWFVTLHPFEDGNGRLARAITDMALAQDEQQPLRFYSLSAQILRERAGYYDVLERCQRGDLDITPWLEWFLVQVEAAATAAEKLIERTLAKARFWLRHHATPLNERQRKVLNRMLDAENFEGGMTTRKYMGLTKTSRATAYRELMDLVEKKCLASAAGAGRSASYQLVSE